MKRLYINLASFIFLIGIIVIGIDILSMRGYTREIIAEMTDSEEYFVNNGPDLLIPIVRKAQSQDQTKELIIGDSFCYQIINGLQENNPDYAILPSNGGVTMAGQYIIAKEYLENHPDATDVYLMILPESLGRTYDTKWGYQYAVMPFVETDTLDDLDSDTIEIIKDTYGEFFLNKPVVTAIDNSGINRKLYFNYIREKTEGYIPKDDFEFADRYVCKIAELCYTNGVSFHMIPCPVCESKRQTVEKMMEEYNKHPVSEVCPDFFENIVYYPEELSVDGTHIAVEYRTKEFMNSMIRDMLKDRDILEHLDLYH